MTPYCSSTGTRTIRENFLAHGWRVLWVASGHNWDSKPYLPYAIDNGAWSAYQNGREFDVAAFEKCLMFSERFAGETGLAPDWTVLPDIVAQGLVSLDYSLRWMDRVRPYSEKVLIAVQDGMEPWHVEKYLDENTGVFIGGSTPWKLSTLDAWGEVARGKCYLHCGRVNTVKRIKHCESAGCHSFDGTSACRWPATFGLINRARKQMALPFGG